MVARRRRKPDENLSEDEAVRALLASVPVSDEDPTTFWGPDFWEVKREIEAERANKRQQFHSEEEFEAFLDQLSKSSADVRSE
jgi:hypothetical protein